MSSEKEKTRLEVDPQVWDYLNEKFGFDFRATMEDAIENGNEKCKRIMDDFYRGRRTDLVSFFREHNDGTESKVSFQLIPRVVNVSGADSLENEYQIKYVDVLAPKKSIEIAEREDEENGEIIPATIYVRGLNVESEKGEGKMRDFRITSESHPELYADLTRKGENGRYVTRISQYPVEVETCFKNQEGELETRKNTYFLGVDERVNVVVFVTKESLERQVKGLCNALKDDGKKLFNKYTITDEMVADLVAGKPVAVTDETNEKAAKETLWYDISRGDLANVFHKDKGQFKGLAMGDGKKEKNVEKNVEKKETTKKQGGKKGMTPRS